MNDAAPSKDPVRPGLGGKQRRHLRGLAHALKPVVHLGKQGLSDAVVASVDAALGDHELIKIRFVDWKDEKKSLLEELSVRLDCDVVGTVGHLAILYRPARDPDKRRIRLPPPADG
ncbi:MAG: ribosome assembly RNA-binding protein YhbY [Acidobacteriota bacterium]